MSGTSRKPGMSREMWEDRMRRSITSSGRRRSAMSRVSAPSSRLAGSPDDLTTPAHTSSDLTARPATLSRWPDAESGPSTAIDPAVPGAVLEQIVGHAAYLAQDQSLAIQHAHVELSPTVSETNCPLFSARSARVQQPPSGTSQSFSSPSNASQSSSSRSDTPHSLSSEPESPSSPTVLPEAAKSPPSILCIEIPPSVRSTSPLDQVKHGTAHQSEVEALHLVNLSLGALHTKEDLDEYAPDMFRSYGTREGSPSGPRLGPPLSLIQSRPQESDTPSAGAQCMSPAIRINHISSSPIGPTFLDASSRVSISIRPPTPAVAHEMHGDPKSEDRRAGKHAEDPPRFCGPNRKAHRRQAYSRLKSLEAKVRGPFANPFLLLSAIPEVQPELASPFVERPSVGSPSSVNSSEIADQGSASSQEEIRKARGNETKPLPHFRLQPTSPPRADHLRSLPTDPQPFLKVRRSPTITEAIHLIGRPRASPRPDGELRDPKPFSSFSEPRQSIRCRERRGTGASDDNDNQDEAGVVNHPSAYYAVTGSRTCYFAPRIFIRHTLPDISDKYSQLDSIPFRQRAHSAPPSPLSTGPTNDREWSLLYPRLNEYKPPKSATPQSVRTRFGCRWDPGYWWGKIDDTVYGDQNTSSSASPTLTPMSNSLTRSPSPALQAHRMRLPGTPHPFGRHARSRSHPGATSSSTESEGATHKQRLHLQNMRFAFEQTLPALARQVGHRIIPESRGSRADPDEGIPPALITPRRYYYNLTSRGWNQHGQKCYVIPPWTLLSARKLSYGDTARRAKEALSEKAADSVTESLGDGQLQQAEEINVCSENDNDTEPHMTPHHVSYASVMTPPAGTTPDIEQTPDDEGTLQTPATTGRLGEQDTPTRPSTRSATRMTTVLEASEAEADSDSMTTEEETGIGQRARARKVNKGKARMEGERPSEDSVMRQEE